MTRFPPYPRDILSRADALLSSKYPDGIVDPRFVEVACEAMMAQREFDAKIALPTAVPQEWMEDSQWPARLAEMQRIAKAIRGTE